MATVNNDRFTRHEGDENTKVSPQPSEQNSVQRDKRQELEDAVSNPAGKKRRFDEWLNGETNNKPSPE
jgi:hypothetical protein